MSQSSKIYKKIIKPFRVITVLALLWMHVGYCSNTHASSMSFAEFKTAFIEACEKFNLAPLQLSYVSNFNAIKSKTELAVEEKYFKYAQKELKNYNPLDLSDVDALDYQIMTYETALNLERIQLELHWLDNKIQLNDRQSILYLPNGKKWYAYYLKKWVDASVNPNEIFQFGLDEIEKVKQEMTRIRESSGMNQSNFESYLNNPDFYLKNSQDIQETYESIKTIVDEKVKAFFPFTESIPDLNIDKGTNRNLAHVPAYYTNNTFFYNYFGEAYTKRQMGWIYIHEGVPGHHYQMSVNNLVKRSEVQNLFRYYGFIEGWGAYVEQFCALLQACQTSFDDYGKYEWDLVRSVRVALDVGINYYGWNDDKAMAFWQKHIPNKNAIAKREIARIKRWPAQVVTYKYGKKIFDELKAESETAQQLKAIHKNILKHGDIPLSILKEKLLYEEL